MIVYNIHIKHILGSDKMYSIRRIGTADNARHDGNFSIDRPRGYDCYLLLFVKTKAVFYLDGAENICKPNTLILYNVGTPHRYKAFGGEYVNDWVQFDSDELPPIPLDKLIYVGDAVDISGYFRLIYDAFYRRNYRACALLLRAVFAEISAVCGRSAYRSPYSPELIKLRKTLYDHPERKWSIRSMSEQLHVSEPYLQELYKGAFGVTCGADVINARIEFAKILIEETDLNITEISGRCGYESIIHFSRQFKKMTGVSPSAYRKQYKSI